MQKTGQNSYNKTSHHQQFPNIGLCQKKIIVVVPVNWLFADPGTEKPARWLQQQQENAKKSQLMIS